MSLPDLPKAYDPQEAQRTLYPMWLERGYFHADPSSPKPPYTIVIPPPNVTGALHLGHALNNTLQDILIRWKRMQGFDALWMPGTDHAGIATQAVVERRLKQETGQTRRDVGRAGLVERIWAWKDEYEKRILKQLRQMGCSCDWERTRFTLDAVCARAVRETFFRLFRAGKIYRGKRLVNWDTHLQTAVADDEIESEPTMGSLWTIRYPVTDSSESLLVATTRPETMLGDTAVAVHPSDDRYKHLIGRTVTLPLRNRPIPIVADAILVNPEFGTGAVKVTPAHDPNDYATGVRHSLPMINLLNPDGTYNENAGAYAGLPVKEVRKRVVADLEAQGLLVKVEPHALTIPLSDRSKTPIEPYLSDQWFVRMGDEPDGAPGFAQKAMDAVTSGAVKVTPERYAKSYLDWLGEKRDWCVSRQLWWGHRIPIWYCSTCTESDLRAAFADRDDVAWTGDDAGGWLVCGRSDLSPDALGAGHRLTQDEDVLDTWFSSALWPHSTLGWPESTPELAKYYPTSVLSTARDIITLWVARMVIFGQFNVGDVPFKEVFIHPVIQDGNGKRMSKSAGNGIDPVDIIESYGADALRFTLALSATETQDLKMPVEPVKDEQGRIATRPVPGEPPVWVDAAKVKDVPKDQRVNTSEKFEQGRTFPNKLWNAARFAMMNLDGYEPAAIPAENLRVEDRWIMDRLATVAAEATAALEAFRFADATRALRDFTWNDFCDWYVEFVKGRLRDPEAKAVAQGVIAHLLDSLCRLLHPVMPFVTEQVWQAMAQVAPVRGYPAPAAAPESVCIAEWPSFSAIDADDSEATVEQWREKIAAIRNLRAERNVPPSAKVAPIILASGAVAARLREGEAIIRSMTNSSSLTIAEAAERPAESASAVLADAEVILPLAGLIDRREEAAKLKKQVADLDKQLAPNRAKLGNEAFTSRAPAEVVAGLRAKVAELDAQRQAVSALLHAAESAAAASR